MRQAASAPVVSYGLQPNSDCWFKSLIGARPEMIVPSSPVWAAAAVTCPAAGWQAAAPGSEAKAVADADSAAMTSPLPAAVMSLRINGPSFLSMDTIRRVGRFQHMPTRQGQPLR